MATSLMQAPRGQSDKKQGEDEAYAASIASTLARLKPRAQAVAKVKIQQILLEAEFSD